MRDVTRGGLATVLSELADARDFGVELFEPEVPVSEPVASACGMLGMDPLYLANEGKVVMVVEGSEAQSIAAYMKSHPLGIGTAVIGEVTDEHPGEVVLHTTAGGSRLVHPLAGEQLPRIC